MEAPDAICASSCAYAFLGAGYRYLGEGGRIGVHKFYSEDADLTSADALDVSQTLTAEIAAYLLEMRVSPTFLNDIVSAPGDGMNWVSIGRLKEAHVLTEGIYSETVEYTNFDGKLVLSVEQIAETGSSAVLLACGSEGMTGYAYLSEPEMVMIDEIQVVINEVAFTVLDPHIISRDDRELRVFFEIPPDAVQAMQAHSEIGVIVTTPGNSVFFGFSGSVRDPKIADLAATCPVGRALPGMTRYPDYDVRGGDLTSTGLRGVSLRECEQICIAASECVGVSYVTAKQWCWPKNPNGVVTPAPGIVTSLR